MRITIGVSIFVMVMIKSLVGNGLAAPNPPPVPPNPPPVPPNPPLLMRGTPAFSSLASSREIRATRVEPDHHGLVTQKEGQIRESFPDNLREVGHIEKAIELGMDAVRFINQRQVARFQQRAQEAIVESQQADLTMKKPNIQEVVQLFNESIVRAEQGDVQVASQLASRAVDTLKRVKGEMDR